jgi:hypothetical protein
VRECPATFHRGDDGRAASRDFALTEFVSWTSMQQRGDNRMLIGAVDRRYAPDRMPEK